MEKIFNTIFNMQSFRYINFIFLNQFFGMMGNIIFYYIIPVLLYICTKRQQPEITSIIFSNYFEKLFKIISRKDLRGNIS